MVFYEQGIQKILINCYCESRISMRHLSHIISYRSSSPSTHIFTVMLVSRVIDGTTKPVAWFLKQVPMRHSFSSADSDESTGCSWRKYICESSKRLFEVHRNLLRRVCIGIPTFIAKTLAGASFYQLNQPRFSFLELE